MISRRQFSVTLLACTARFGLAASEDVKQAGRKLDFQIDGGFGDSDAADIEAVIRSAADCIWKYCPHTRWEVPGFYIYHTKNAPITLYDHRPDGRIAIGLTSTDKRWAQFAFQFAHEFCHALAGHSNDWHKPWIRERKANHWLEESMCETASLFALRAMGLSWQTDPPYPNWKDYAPHLTEYAADRMADASSGLAPDQSFVQWFHENEPAMRRDSTLRAKNNIVATKLLPVFEETSGGWESVSFYNLGKREADKSLRACFLDWGDVVPPDQKPFVVRLASVFGL